MTARLDVEAMFKKKGWGMLVGEENDKCVRMPELADYSWSMDDFGDADDAEDGPSDDEDGPEELATVEEERGGEGEESDEGDESSEEEQDDVDPGPWEDNDTWKAVLEPTKPKAKLVIAHKFLTDTGWEVGRIVHKSRGSWAVKYPSETQQYVHELNMSDYGPSAVWVVVTQAS